MKVRLSSSVDASLNETRQEERESVCVCPRMPETAEREDTEPLSQGPVVRFHTSAVQAWGSSVRMHVLKGKLNFLPRLGLAPLFLEEKGSRLRISLQEDVLFPGHILLPPTPLHPPRSQKHV